MVKLLHLPSSLAISSIISASKLLSLQDLSLTRAFSQNKASPTTMSINLQSHAFAGNPLRSKSPNSGDPFSPTGALETLKTRILDSSHTASSSPIFKVLPFRNGRPLASTTSGSGESPPIWHLGWIGLDDLKGLLDNSGVQLSGDTVVYLSSRTEDDVVYWAIDVSTVRSLVPELGSTQFCFVELRTLMVATDWADLQAMGNLAIAGHARALLEWHNISCFCGHCGEKTVSMEAGRQKQCSNESCRKRIYPQVDPVVIMLVIDRENDYALLSKQSRFVPRMWSCLASFIEPGESLEEAVRRKMWEEIGVEVGEVVYHSSQPWPVGPNSLPCQLMVGFYAYAKSFEINVNAKELEALSISNITYVPCTRKIITKFMEVFRPGAVVLQCGADSLSGDRLGCFNLSIRGHAECVRYMRSFNVPLLLLGGGGYTIRNVARCWCYETGIALGIEVDDKMPQHEYYEYFGADYTLHVTPSNMENKNSRHLIDEIRCRLLDNLSKLQHALSVQFQEKPPDTDLGEANEDHDDADERWDPDFDMDIDNERELLPSKEKGEMVVPQHKKNCFAFENWVTKKMKWETANKTYAGGPKNGEVFLTALLQKPVSR